MGRFSPTKPIGTTTTGHYVALPMNESEPNGVCPRSPLIVGEAPLLVLAALHGPRIVEPSVCLLGKAPAFTAVD